MSKLEYHLSQALSEARETKDAALIRAIEIAIAKMNALKK